MKKRLLYLAAGFLSLTAFIPACDIFEDCGTCELVTINADGTTTYGTPLLYCGDQLKEKQDASPTTIGGVTTYWDCY